VVNFKQGQSGTAAVATAGADVSNVMLATADADPSVVTLMMQVSWLQGQMAVLEQVVLDLQEEQSSAVQAAQGAAQDEQHIREHLEGGSIDDLPLQHILLKSGLILQQPAFLLLVLLTYAQLTYRSLSVIKHGLHWVEPG
jgi:hypothetical protein